MKASILKSIVCVSGLIVLLLGCDRTELVRNYGYTSDVREMAGGYIMYEIENGTVTCREQKYRSELACWKNR